MYCKNCGKEIDDNSSFCKYCGKSQGNCNNSLSNKPVWLIYLIWAIVNLYLLMGDKESDASDFFFPSIFTNEAWNKWYYDFSEFLFYVFILPLVVYVIYRRYQVKINKFLKNFLNI